MANTSEQKTEGPKSSKVGIIIGIVIIILLLIVIIILLLTKGSNTGKEEVQETKRNVVITEDNAGEVIKDMVEAKNKEENTLGTNYYAATMNYEWRFPTGDSPSENAYVENSKKNTTAVYFDVFLADNENEPIYESPIIPVGNNLRGFSLEKKLDAGTYDCICVYHLVDDDQNTLSTLRVKVKVIVEQ